LPSSLSNYISLQIISQQLQSLGVLLDYSQTLKFIHIGIFGDS